MPRAALPIADHPRACGENLTGGMPMTPTEGSPPRVRGKRFERNSAQISLRITPARAGKTKPATRCWPRCRDHPRACGENALNETVQQYFFGSPPRVRGKQSQPTKNVTGGRITPARAGKTPRLVWRNAENSDHPRACGENMATFEPNLMLGGSPPRVRGKPQDRYAVSHAEGITPARAGKTGRHRPALRTAPDHPRACGENYHGAAALRPFKGSPPRVRGKPPLVERGAAQVRITPARAGKTSLRRPTVCCRRDHPRACGENDAGVAARARELGSPPRVRGKLDQPDFRPVLPGITPARAGKTRS